MTYKAVAARRPIDPHQASAARRHLLSVRAVVARLAGARVLPYPPRAPFAVAEAPENVTEWTHKLRLPPAPRL